MERGSRNGRFLEGAVAPVVAAIVIAPGGLAHTWYYFAIFAGVIIGLMLEAVPGTAIGVTLVTVLCE